MLFGKPPISLDAVRFDAAGHRPAGEVDGRRVWFTPEGDALALYLFRKPPDLPRSITSSQQLRELYARHLPEGARVVEAELVTVDGVRSVWTLFRVPRAPDGTTYLASLTLPFAAFSFVLKLQCEEQGVTGTREVAVLVKALKAGEVTADGAGDVAGDWSADEAAYDDLFPDHPVSRARRAFARLRATLRIDARVRAEPRFLDDVC